MTDTATPSHTEPIDWDELWDVNGYPSDYACEVVSSFYGSPRQLVELIQRLWYPAGEYATATATDDGHVEVRLITCGWSGNEELVSALNGTMFHMRWWDMDKRGGLHVFLVESTAWDTVSALGHIGKPSVYRMP